MKLRFSFAVCAGLLSAAAAAHPLDGRIWDVRAQAFVEADAVYQRAAASRYVLLGETHDNPLHHDLQLAVLKALAQRGRSLSLAMEQFDHERQTEIAAAQAAGGDAEKIADAGQFNRKGWRWPMYKDLIDHAAAQRWPVLAANLSRADARDIALGRVKPQLPQADAAQVAAIAADIVDGHCGERPEYLDGMVEAQRARDARMAATLESAATPAVLIAGAGHVRRDRAVPRYLKDPGGALAVAYLETEDGKTAPADYDTAGLDFVWFTPRTERPDPCAAPLVGTAAPASSVANHDKEKP